MNIPGYHPDPWNFWAESHRSAGETVPLCWRGPIQQELPSLYSLWAATVCYCGTAKSHCGHELQIWVNIESTWLMSWLLKQDPTWYDTHPIMEQIPCIYILIDMVWSVSQQIWSGHADQQVLIIILRYMKNLGQTMVSARNNDNNNG